MKKKEIFWVLVLILFGIVYNFYKSGELVFFKACSVHSRKLVSQKNPKIFQGEKVLISNVKAIKKISINNPAGAIEINRSADGFIHIEPTIKVFHKSKKRAKKIYEEIKIGTREIDDGLVVAITAKNDFPYRRVRVDFKFRIPENIELDLRNRYGNVDINDTGRRISVNQNHGDLFVKNINAPLKIKSHHGLVRIYNINSNVDLYSNFSKIRIKKVPNLTLRCSQAKVWIEDVEDEVDTTYSGYSVFVVDNIGKFGIDARHTRLKLKNVKSDINIKNSHALIYMEEIQGDMEIKSRECKIILDKITSDNIVINNSFNSIDINNLSCKNLDISLQHGKLDVRLKKIEEQLAFKTKYTDVSIGYPPTLQPYLNIISDNGDIINRTDRNFTVTKHDQKSHLITMEGQPKITIISEYGDIILKN